MHTKKLNLHAKFFFEKCLFAYEICFAIEKKQKVFGPNFQNYFKIFCVAIKKCHS